MNIRLPFTWTEDTQIFLAIGISSRNSSKLPAFTALKAFSYYAWHSELDEIKSSQVIFWLAHFRRLYFCSAIFWCLCSHKIYLKFHVMIGLFVWRYHLATRCWNFFSLNSSGKKSQNNYVNFFQCIVLCLVWKGLYVTWMHYSWKIANDSKYILNRLVVNT